MISDELKDLKKEAKPAPDYHTVPRETRDDPTFQLGWTLGWHDAIDQAIDIAEDEEDA